MMAPTPPEELIANAIITDLDTIHRILVTAAAEYRIECAHNRVDATARIGAFVRSAARREGWPDDDADTLADIIERRITTARPQ